MGMVYRNDVNLTSSQVLRYIQNGGTEKTLEHAAKILHVFCYVTHQDTLNFCLCLKGQSGKKFQSPKVELSKRSLCHRQE